MLACLFHSEETPQQVTPVTSTYAEIHLSQESPKTFSLGKQNSNTYSQKNVAACRQMVNTTCDQKVFFILAGSPKGAALKSNSYNVMMVGDSSVGKSSFMKRAQSGKFSLDLPSSVGKLLI